MSEILQKDLVLSPNEYAYVLDETKGNVACNVGPHKMSLSQSDKLVRFDNEHKRFVTCGQYRDAIQLFTIAPEGWYIALKNPAPNNKHPQPGTSNSIPENMQIGCKINIPGPISFALYPGQMTQVIKGHSLRSNQYLIAKVYDADELNSKQEGNEEDAKYVNGQTLIIKGTEVSFYIPPTGIEVKAIDNNVQKGYVRDAVTLERLEYCILKDENGTKRYMHGPAVVFPNPTETFVISPKGGYVFRAIELSKISGIYVKVIAEYQEGDVVHPVGEELFITGDTQMIYYPRPEHAIISYDNKITHHAIAIPEGEGRYIMNRLTGEIKTIKGPAMYLPDPRTEVVVKRKLSPSQCKLWYPGNEEALEYNRALTEKSVEKSLKAIDSDAFSFLASYSDDAMMANLESKANISRGTSYTKPRTITLDNKYDGVVSIDVWTGYAVNIISKNGDRRIVCGPQTVLLDYDQTLEVLELSTGKPKTTDTLEKVVFLRYDNGRVSDVVNVETKDFVKASIKVSYHINFDEEMKDRWFSVDNYVKHLCDWVRSTVKKAVKNYTISEFHAKYQEIFTEAISDSGADYLHKFNENGMIISDVEILSMTVEPVIQKLIDEHQATIVSRTLDLTAAQNAADMERQIVALNKEKVELAEHYAQFKIEQEAATQAKDYALAVAHSVKEDAEVVRQEQIKEEIQKLRLKMAEAERAKVQAERDNEIAFKQAIANIEAEREAKSADAISLVIKSIGPELSAALQSSANTGVVTALAESISPYAIAKNESVSDAVSRLLRGTTMEELLKHIKKD